MTSLRRLVWNGLAAAPRVRGSPSPSPSPSPPRHGARSFTTITCPQPLLGGEGASSPCRADNHNRNADEEGPIFTVTDCLEAVLSRSRARLATDTNLGSSPSPRYRSEPLHRGATIHREDHEAIRSSRSSQGNGDWDCQEALRRAFDDAAAYEAGAGRGWMLRVVGPDWGLEEGLLRSGSERFVDREGDDESDAASQMADTTSAEHQYSLSPSDVLEGDVSVIANFNPSIFTSSSPGTPRRTQPLREDAVQPSASMEMGQEGSNKRSGSRSARRGASGVPKATTYVEHTIEYFEEATGRFVALAVPWCPTVRTPQTPLRQLLKRDEKTHRSASSLRTDRRDVRSPPRKLEPERSPFCGAAAVVPPPDLLEIFSCRNDDPTATCAV